MKPRHFVQIPRAIALLAICFAAFAEEGPATAKLEADWAKRLQDAAELQAAGRQRQAEADKLQAEKHTECLKKFFVISCQKDADAEHLTATKESRVLINQGKAIERQVKKEQLSDEDARRANQATLREADRQQRQLEVAEERQDAAEQKAATQAKKTKQAEEGSQRKAEEAERARQKQAAHDARVAEKKAAAERRAASAKSQ